MYTRRAEVNEKMSDRLPVYASCCPAALMLAALMLVLGAGVAEASPTISPLVDRDGRGPERHARVACTHPRPQPLTGYQIEAGPSPGVTSISLPLGNVLGYRVIAPDGRYFVRVRAPFGATPGPASNEVDIAVPSLPAPPADVTVTVARLSVALSWRHGAGSSPVTGWQVQAGSAPGLSHFANERLPSAPRA
jgi:hypothetical protein